MEFIKDFWSLNLNQYENIGLYFPVGVFLVLLCVVMSGAAFFLTYYKRNTVTLYKQLLRHEATCEDKAKTLRELRLDASHAIRSALSKSSGQLTYVVKRVGEVKENYEEYIKKSKGRGYKPEKINFDEARFYIAEDKVDIAKKNVSGAEPAWWKPIAITVTMVVIVVLLAIFLPDILSAMNKNLA